MCFFDQYRFACGDWKWGHFRQHCAKEYRIGETCGMKLVMQTVPIGTRCKLCEKIDTKMRRRAAEVDRIGRWQREGSKFRASIDKAMEIIQTLDGETSELSAERHRRQVAQENLGPVLERGADIDEEPPVTLGPLAYRDEDIESDWGTDPSSIEEQCDASTRVHQNFKASQHPALNLLRAIASDSGYHSGYGLDTESVCSSRTSETSLGLPGDLLQDFVGSFSDSLFRLSGAQTWAAFTMARLSQEEAEKEMKMLLRDYSMMLLSVASTPSNERNIARDLCQLSLKGASRLIRCHRAQIARVFCGRLFAFNKDKATLANLLQNPQGQLSLLERVELLSTSGLPRDGIEIQIPGDQDEDEVLETDIDNGLSIDLPQICDRFFGSDALKPLSGDIRRRLYRDDKIELDSVAAIMQEDTLFRQKSQLHEACFNVHWPLKEFMQMQYGRDILHIGSVIVLTGSVLYAQATTCAEYVMRTWPNTELALINTLDNILRLQLKDGGSQESKSVCKLDVGDLTTDVALHDARISIFASTTEESVLVDIGQQLAWLGSAFRISPYPDSAYFSPLFLRKGPRAFEIMFKHARIHETEKACWLPLFHSAVLASGFPIADREDESGIEISIEILACISGVRHAVEYEGGAVMKSFSHLFAPIRKTAGCVQWHAVTNEDSESRISYQEGVSRCASRAMLSAVSMKEAMSLRAIVGWCSVAKSQLGAPSASYGAIGYSQAEEASSNSVRCSGGSLGFQQIGLAQLDFRFGAKDGKSHFQRKGTFARIAQVTETTPIALYDTGSKRAWLVPASQVLLHVVQYRHRLDPFPFDGNPRRLDTDIPPGLSAKQILIRNGSLVLSKEEEYTFKDEVLNIWSLLEFILDQNVARYRNANGVSINPTLREYLYGFEFKAVVQERSPFRLKQTEIGKTNGGWPALLEDIDALVLFADGFEDLLLPYKQGNDGLCSQWGKVPAGKDYLTTTVKMLLQLHDEAGCRLRREYLSSKRKIQWHQGSSVLFESCKNILSCECNRLQRLFPKSGMGKVVPPALLLQDGAVIFGRPEMSTRLGRVLSTVTQSKFFNHSDAQVKESSTVGQYSDDEHYLEHSSTNTSSTAHASSLDSEDTQITEPDVVVDVNIDEQVPTPQNASSTIASQDDQTERVNINAASIDQAMERIKLLDQEIYELSCERQRRLQAIGH